MAGEGHRRDTGVRAGGDEASSPSEETDALAFALNSEGDRDRDVLVRTAIGAGFERRVCCLNRVDVSARYGCHPDTWKSITTSGSSSRMCRAIPMSESYSEHG